jgi:hypothetical protein
MLIGHTTPTSVPIVKTIASRAPTDNLLSEFPGLARPMGIHREVWHTMHHIRTKPEPPVACSPHCLAPDRLAVAKAEFDAMLRDSTAEHTDKGPGPSALHLLLKKGSHQRPYGDYCALKACTIPEQHPIRHTKEYAFPVVPSSPKLT